MEGVNEPQAEIQILGAAFIFPLIAVMYWLAAEPPSLWILPLTGAGLLLGIGTIIYIPHRPLS
jgi:hypothetical protein